MRVSQAKVDRVVIEALCALQKIKVRRCACLLSARISLVAFRCVLPYETTSSKIPAVINRTYSSISAGACTSSGRHDQLCMRHVFQLSQHSDALAILDSRAQTRLLRPCEHRLLRAVVLVPRSFQRWSVTLC